MAQKWHILAESLSKFSPLLLWLIGLALMAAICGGLAGFETLRAEEHAATELRLSASAAATATDTPLKLFVHRANTFRPADFVASDRLGATARLIRLQNAIPDATAIFMVNAAGQLLAASAPFPVGESDVSNSQWFHRALAGPAGILTIERVDASWLRLGPTVIVTMPLVQPSATPVGLVGMVLPVENLRALAMPPWLSPQITLRLRNAEGQDLLDPPSEGPALGVAGAVEPNAWQSRILLSIAELTGQPRAVHLVVPLQSTTATVDATIDLGAVLGSTWHTLRLRLGLLGLGFIGLWLVLFGLYFAGRAHGRQARATLDIPFGIDWTASVDEEGRLSELAGIAPVIFRQGIGTPFLSLICPAEVEDIGFARLETAFAARLSATDITVAVANKEGPAEFHSLSVSLNPLGGHFRVRGRNITGEVRSAQAESEAAAARTETNTMARERDRVLAAVGHDVRTPMNSILGICSLLLAGDMEDEHRSWIEKIRGSCDALLAMLNGLLEVASSAAGQAELQIDEVDVVGLIRDVAEVFVPQAQDKNLTFHTRIDELLAGLWYVDPTRLRQVLFNLLGNAIKYTSNGSVELRAAAIVDAEGRTVVRITVSDTGPGIPPEDRGRIFERFKRGRNEDSEGLGLGLALCRENAALMNGTLMLETSHGVGSEFTFEFPSGRVAVQASPFVGRTALILGFDATTRERVRGHFGRLGFHAETADDGFTGPGVAARVAARHNALDLVVLDAALIGIPAEIVVARLRSTPFGREAAIIAVIPPDLESENISVHVDATIPASNDLSMISSTAAKLLGEQNSLDLVAPNTRRLSGGRILVVEDNKVNQSLLTAALSIRGFSAFVASNGQEAVRLASYDSFDAILMDLQMPGTDGFEATRYIRAMPGRAGTVPIIAITAFSGALIRKRCLEAGFTGVLEKPVNLDHLGRCLHRWIGDSSLENDQFASANSEDLKKAEEPKPELSEIDIVDAFLACMIEDIGLARTRACLTEFVTDATTRCQHLRELLPGWEAESIGRTCHDIAPLAANFGAVTLSDALEELALAAHNDAREAAERLVSTIEILTSKLAPTMFARLDFIATSIDRKAA